jgi:hypothetical protein
VLLMVPLQKKRVDSLTTPSVSRVLIFKTRGRDSQYSDKNLQKTFRVWKPKSYILLWCAGLFISSYSSSYSSPSPSVHLFIFSFPRSDIKHMRAKADYQNSNRTCHVQISRGWWLSCL